MAQLLLRGYCRPWPRRAAPLPFFEAKLARARAREHIIVDVGGRLRRLAAGELLARPGTASRLNLLVALVAGREADGHGVNELGGLVALVMDSGVSLLLRRQLIRGSHAHRRKAGRGALMRVS